MLEPHTKGKHHSDRTRIWGSSNKEVARSPTWLNRWIRGAIRLAKSWDAPLYILPLSTEPSSGSAVSMSPIMLEDSSECSQLEVTPEVSFWNKRRMDRLLSLRKKATRFGFNQMTICLDSLFFQKPIYMMPHSCTYMSRITSKSSVPRPVA